MANKYHKIGGRVMVIANNLLSLTANQNLKKTENRSRQATQRLSTGYQINKSADDAAGLMISMKMRSQIRGLDQASDNIGDGTSLIQIADGAMGDIQSILDRITQLCVKSATDTNQSIDRDNIQREINQLKMQIEDISDNTKFNNIKILQGNDVQPIFDVNGSMPPWTKSGMANSTPLGGLTDTLIIDNASVMENHSASYIDFSNLNASNANDLLNSGFHTTCCTCDNRYSIKFVDTGDKVSNQYENFIYEVDITGITTPDALIDRVLSVLDGSHSFVDQNGNTISTKQPQSHFTEFAAELDGAGNKTGRLVMFDNREGVTPDYALEQGVVKEGIYETIGMTGLDGMYIQTGANSGDAVKLMLPDARLSAIGLSGSLSVTSYSSANTTLSLVSQAKDNISRQRSKIGAMQNRLEYARTNANNMAENTQAAESRISDTDMATEMVKYAKESILRQTNESILSQANAIPKGVLNLLQ